MTVHEFVRAPEPPRGSVALRALWHDHHGRWDEAHRLVMDADEEDCAWVHAYLHRKEGDLPNARYWYRRARRAEARESLEEEWTSIATALLASTGEAG